MEKKLIVTFRSTTMALMMEHVCKTEGAPGRLIPLPREIDAGCGMAWAASPENEQRLRELMERKAIRFEAICMLNW